MNAILLRPTDVLFFRDGRPMSGSLAGHTAAWPLPDVTNHALHAALHRAGLDGVHSHRRGRSGEYSEQRDRKFGSVVSAGPFPVDEHGRWFFPRPKDAQQKSSVELTFKPVRSMKKDGDESPWAGSSLPKPLEYAVASTRPPDKEAGEEPWLSSDAFTEYLRQHRLQPGTDHFLRDESIADREANLGIGIDPDTQTTGQETAAGKIYTAHYLRLRDGFQMGLIAAAEDKEYQHPEHGRDLLRSLLNGNPTRIVVGGQQRICTATLQSCAGNGLPMPRGLTTAADFTVLSNGRIALKWILLSPAIFPEIPATKKDGSPQNPHPGGWLPNWVDARTGKVLLTSGAGIRKSQRKPRVAAGGTIAARLVAALVPKPIPVTGWALPNDTDRPQGGAKSTHLAVPAGAVYYFEADSPQEASKLAAALNWHGDTPGTQIKNRRSTLLGEKGFGLGVCGTWNFYENNAGKQPRP